jgi:hypothetical protein
VNAEQGPLDFAWSQNIKSEPDDLIPTYAFKSPTVILQQGAIFVALMPELSSRRVEPLDLDVTSEKRPWISFGQIPSQPHGHSYIRRTPDGHPKALADAVQYSYPILASQQPTRLGYRRVVRRLWAHSDMNLCSTLLVCSRTLSSMNCARSLPGAMRHGTHRCEQDIHPIRLRRKALRHTPSNRNMARAGLAVDSCCRRKARSAMLIQLLG